MLDGLARKYFSHRFLALSRWEIHFLRLKIGNALRGQAAKARAFLASRQAPVFLNLGSGPRGLDNAHWVNIDGYWDKNVHFLMDISRPLPFPDASLDGVFSEHVLEHFNREGGLEIAKDMLRLLKPGGVLRVIVPNGGVLLRRYVEDSKALTDYRPAGTAMDVINSFSYQRYEHQYLYDFETMAAVLKQAGFETVEEASCGHGQRPELLLDDPIYEWESLYVEARKAQTS